MFEIVQVNVGMPQLLGERHDQQVYSSIAKARVTESTLYLTRTGLAGDQQADTGYKAGKQVHGGHTKAVYAYPYSHYRRWREELAQYGLTELTAPAFGENLLIAGITETAVHIGDVFAWGDALLCVSVPRRPCFKLGMHLSPRVSAAMISNGRCGWYFSVNKPGVVPVGGRLELAEAGSGPSIAAAFAEKVAADSSVPDLRQDL